MRGDGEVMVVVRRGTEVLVLHRSPQCDAYHTAAVQYFAVVDGPTMTPLDHLHDSVRILASIALGDVRLLDNIGIELAAA